MQAFLVVADSPQEWPFRFPRIDYVHTMHFDPGIVDGVHTMNFDLGIKPEGIPSRILKAPFPKDINDPYEL